MKRFTLFLALCLTMIGAALAGNITNINQLNEAKKYTISCARGYLLIHGDNPILKGNKEAGLDLDLGNKNFFFQFKQEGGNYYLFNVGANKYVKKDKTLSETATDAIQFDAQDDGTFRLYFDATHNINLGGSNQVIIDGWTTADAGNKMTIFELPDQLVTVTWNYYINNQLYNTKYQTLLPNTNCTAPAADFFVADGQSASNTGSEPSLTIDVNGHENLPFVKSTKDAPVWQAIRIHKNQNRWWSASGSGTSIAEINPDIISEDDYFWCFEGDLIHGFTIYNKAVGTDNPLKAGDAPLFDKESTANSVWTLKANQSKDAGWFCLYDAKKTYINCDIPNKQIAYWSQADAGSSMKVYSPADVVLSQDVKDAAVAPVNAVGNYAYVKDASNREALATAVQAVNANNYNIDAARDLGTIAIAMRATARNTFGTGYYRFYSALEGLYNNNKGVYFNGNKFVWGSIDKRTVAHILKIEASSDDEKPYVVYTCNDKKYMQGVAGAANTNMGDNSKFALAALDGGIQQNVVFGNGTLHASDHGGGSGSGSELVSWGGSANSASAWYIVPATDIEVALNTVGNASYATTYLPFAVEGDGATKLYTGSRGDGVLNMNEVEGVVPAETALVLKGAAGAASTTLTISNIAGRAVGDNALKGTLSNIALNDDNRSNYLVLGRVLVEDEGVIGFYLPSEGATSIAANKAYLNNDSAAAIALNFDDVTTGIGQVATESENAPIFDLSGRRVNSAVKGGLYIQNGKKFIVK